MTRSNYDSATKSWVPSEEYYARKAQAQASKARSSMAAPMVIRDIQPYRSTIDGKMVTSRSEHRAKLREHGCIEVGNERLPPRKKLGDRPRSPVAPAVARAIEELGG